MGTRGKGSKTPPHARRPEAPAVDRRRMIRSLCLGMGALLFASGRAAAYGVRTYFRWTQLRYPGSWDPNPLAAGRFLDTLRRRTSVEPQRNRQVLEVGSPDLFGAPFLYVAGRGGFPDLGEGAVAWLRRYVEHGGFVLFDDATGIRDSGFAQQVGRLASRILPGRELRPLAADHTVYQSFYLIRDVPGRKIVGPFIYGIEIEDLTPLMLFPNDLGGAWDGDPLGGYTYPCTPGGERQREMTFRLGVNLIMYALTGNYKKDQVHIPFILKRRKR